MKKFVLLTMVLAVSVYAVNTTRYWDACKPSCGWDGNAAGSSNGVAKSCNISGAVLGDNAARNACEGGGTAYTCMKQAPWKVSDNLSYGFAASHTNGDCGKCFELSFNNGKKMVVMVSNIGGDVGQNQFDLMIPGGGVGQFNALSTQIQQNGGNSSDLGAQYGGFRANCAMNGNVKECVRQKCNSTFSSAALADLKAGCEWYVDWFDAADNPQANSTPTTCPQALIDKYKGNFSASPTPTPSSNSTGGTSSNSGGGTSSNSSGGSCNPAGRRDTIKIEAENFTSKVGDNIRVEAGSIGYIENGNSVTYNNVNAGVAGQAILQFSIATEVNSTFSVEVNGTNVGTISRGSTGGWSNFQMVSIGSCVTLRAGANTIKLNFQSAVNIDYFMLIGNIVSGSSSSAPSSSSQNLSSSSRASSSSVDAPSSSSLAPSSSSSVDISSSSSIPTPIRSPKIVSGNIRAQATDNTIMLENLPSNAKVEIYNLQGKRIYSTTSHSPLATSLKIEVQTKGMYIVKIGKQTMHLPVI